MESLLIGVVPRDGMVSKHTTSSLLKTVTDLTSVGVDISVAMGEEVLVDPIDSILNRFLLSECDNLLIVDGRMKFTPEDVAKMIDSEKPVISGMYPNPLLSWDTIDTSGDLESLKASLLGVNIQGVGQSQGEYITVDSIGMGFMLLKKEVVLKIKDTFPRSHLVKDFILFMHGGFDINNRALSPEEFFCYVVKYHGFDISVEAGASLIGFAAPFVYGE